MTLKILNRHLDISPVKQGDNNKFDQGFWTLPLAMKYKK